jgi:hypothetical protein
VENKIPNQFVVTASIKKSEKHGEYYQHFGIHHNLLSIYGVTVKDLRRIKFEIIPNVNLENRKETDAVDYWGLYNFEQEKLMLIYPSFIQFHVCFPYGAKNEEDRGRGKCLNLKIVEVLPYE